MTGKARKNYAEGNLAERVGFEPTIRFPVYTLSKRAPSATRPSLPEGRLRTRRELPHLLFYRIDLGSHGCGVWVGAEVVLLYCGPGHRILLEAPFLLFGEDELAYAMSRETVSAPHRPHNPGS